MVPSLVMPFYGVSNFFVLLEKPAILLLDDLQSTSFSGHLCYLKWSSQNIQLANSQ